MPASPHGDRFVALNGTTRTRTDLSVSYPDFVDYARAAPRQRRGSDRLHARADEPADRRGDPQRMFGQLVSGNYFDALGVPPALGRGFLPEEDTTPNGHPVVVLQPQFWQRRFAADPSIVGRTVTLNGRAFTVIGIAPTDSAAPSPTLNLDIWVPMAMQNGVYGGGDRLASRGNCWLEAMVRLKPGVSIARAQSRPRRHRARIWPTTYADDKGRGIELYRAVARAEQRRTCRGRRHGHAAGGRRRRPADRVRERREPAARERGRAASAKRPCV